MLLIRTTFIYIFNCFINQNFAILFKNHNITNKIENNYNNIKFNNKDINTGNKLLNYLNDTSFSNYNVDNTVLKKRVERYMYHDLLITPPSILDGDHNMYNGQNKEYEYNSYLPQLPSSHLQNNYIDNDKNIALKALWGPLVGVALLGIVAALINNPVLLQLGILSGRKRHRSRRRTKNTLLPIISPSSLQSDFIVKQLHDNLDLVRHILSEMPKSNGLNQKRVIANYFNFYDFLRLFEINENCIKRLVCEVWNRKSNLKIIKQYNDQMKMIFREVLNNEFIQTDFKDVINEARRFGEDYGKCDKYECNG
ncbi:uncharacterized protein LOC142333828 [Lycorma delicatula]|uniref:uncharacterized protein LOC142333828 n=1 Tax=Lycorma delicatula TaxID=130591 RepID=UPI003F5104B8